MVSSISSHTRADRAKRKLQVPPLIVIPPLPRLGLSVPLSSLPLSALTCFLLIDNNQLASVAVNPKPRSLSCNSCLHLGSSTFAARNSGGPFRLISIPTTLSLYCTVTWLVLSRLAISARVNPASYSSAARRKLGLWTRARVSCCLFISIIIEHPRSRCQIGGKIVEGCLVWSHLLTPPLLPWHTTPNGPRSSSRPIRDLPHT